MVHLWAGPEVELGHHDSLHWLVSVMGEGVVHLWAGPEMELGHHDSLHWLVSVPGQGRGGSPVGRTRSGAWTS